MRKLLLGAGLFGLLSMPFTSEGQTVYFSDSFDADINNWTLVDDDGDGNDWYWFNAGAPQGGVATSASWASNALNPDNWMVSPAIDLSGASGSLLLTWQAYAQDQSWPAENYTVYVGTDSSISNLVNSPVNFTEVLTTSNGYMNRALDVSSLAGNSTVYVAFRHHNVSDQFRMNIDNVQVMAPLDNDVEVVVAGMAPNVSIQDAPFDIQAIVRSNGINTLTGYDLSYTINGGSATTSAISGVSLDIFESEVVTHPNAWTPTAAGTYTIVVSADSPNGQTDGDPSNNSFSFDVNVFNSSVQRKPLYEVFTSSTCPPCTPGNVNFHGIVANYPDEYVAIKYQQNFPGTGDPYATDESVNRRGYYGINSIPRMEIDGGWDGNANSFTSALHEAARDVPSFVELDVTYSVDAANQTVDYCIDYEALGDLGSATLQIAILESITYDNEKTNGETEFENVMKKMVPSEGGQTIQLTSGSPQQICDSYEFQGSYRLPADGQTANRINHNTEHSVEDFNNLYVIAWIESSTSLEVYQSAEGVEQQNTQYDLAMTSLDSDDTAYTASPYTVMGTVTNMGSEEITSYEVGYSIEGGPAQNTSITGVNIVNMSTDQFTHSIPWAPTAAGSYTIKMWAANPNGNADENNANDTLTTSLRVEDNVGIGEAKELAGSVTLFPNPISSVGKLEITTEATEVLEVSVIDVTGRTMMLVGNVTTVAHTPSSVSIDVSDLASGVYMIKVENDNGEKSVQRFVKN